MKGLWNILFEAFDGNILYMLLGIVGIILSIVYLVLEIFGDRIFKPRP